MNPKDLVGAKKSPLGVVPPALMLGAAPAMAVGANKYGPFNWRAQPVQVMTYIEAIQRHLFAFSDGQDVAEDTGVSHLGHAAAGLGILMDAFAMGNVIDNRPQAGPAADMLREQDKSVAQSNPDIHVTVADPHRTHPATAGCDGVHTEDKAIVSEVWGEGDGTIYGMDPAVWAAYGGPVLAVIEHRGEYPLDVRVNGYLRCCGATEHPLDCPNYR